MRVTIYDNNPGVGFSQWCLKTSWALGCWFQKLVGAVDDYKGVSSWQEARDWLLAQPGPLTVVQFWGHGSPGTTWFAGQPAGADHWKALKPQMTPDSLLWFRACSTFQGDRGFAFAKALTKELNCTVAGHTRIIGVFQGGLHTLKPGQEPYWLKSEAELPGKLAPMGLVWGDHTITCLATKIPEGW